MNVKIPGTIVWISAFYNRTGLAGGSRACVKALHNAGIKIRIVPVDDAKPGIDDCDIDFIKSLEQTPVTPPVTAIFFHNPSKGWLDAQLPEPHVRMMRTGFTGSNVPPDWIDICNSMDQVCFASWDEMSNWITSGINPELARELMGTHVWQFLPIVPLGADGSLSTGRIFRFLSLGTFSPNRRWDALILAYLEEFRANNKVELYLRVNYPNWHPIPGKPRRDLTELINNLRLQTKSNAKIIIDEALGTRLDIVRLMDSCDAYVSTDVSSAAPVGEALFRRKLVIAPQSWGNSRDMLLSKKNTILIPTGNAEKIVVQGEMLHYLPPIPGGLVV